MAKITVIVVLSMIVGVLEAQPAGSDDRLARIEENTKNLKDSAIKTDSRVDAIQTDLRNLQDRVIAVQSQNTIIVSIASTSLALGIAFLVWFWKKLEALMSVKPQFTEEDRVMLKKIDQKLELRFTDADRSVLKKIEERLSSGRSSSSAGI